MIHFSERRANIMKAVAECRRLVVNPKKTRQNPHLKNHYADLGAVFAAIGPAMTDAGLTVIQSPTHEAGQPANILLIETMILHGESGEYMTDVCQFPIAKNDPQGTGSAITYARRYALMAIFGLTASDDDAQRAVKTATDWRREIEQAASNDEIDALVRQAVEAFRNDAGSMRVLQDAATKRRTAIKMGSAVTFNPSEPTRAKKGKATTVIESENPAPQSENPAPMGSTEDF